MWSKPDAIHSVDFALDVAKRTLEYYEDFFKVPYPLPKLGWLKTEKYYNWSFLTWLITSDCSYAIARKHSLFIARGGWGEFWGELQGFQGES